MEYLRRKLDLDGARLYSIGEFQNNSSKLSSFFNPNNLREQNEPGDSEIEPSQLGSFLAKNLSVCEERNCESYRSISEIPENYSDEAKPELLPPLFKAKRSFL